MNLPERFIFHVKDIELRYVAQLNQYGSFDIIAEYQLNKPYPAVGKWAYEDVQEAIDEGMWIIDEDKTWEEDMVSSISPSLIEVL